MRILYLFTCLIYSLNKEAPFLDILPGEWDVVLGSQKPTKNIFSPYSAEFHIDSLTSSVYGSIWANINSSNSMVDLEDVEVAQLEIVFQGPFSGDIYNLQPNRNLMTHFDFKQANFGMSLISRGKINDEYNFQLTITNGTIFQVFIMSSKSSKVSEFYAIKMAKNTSSSSTSNYIKIAIIVCVLLIILQIFLWGLLKYCKTRMDNKLTQQQESVVIDLDKYSEYLKNQAKAKAD